MKTTNKLRQIRLQAGLTMQQLADEAHVSRPVIERAEHSQKIRQAYAARITKALNRLAGTAYTSEELEIVVGER